MSITVHPVGLHHSVSRPTAIAAASRPHPAPTAHDTVHLSSAATRAAQISQPLRIDYGTARHIDLQAHSGKRSAAWPYSQDMVASLDRGDYREFDKLNSNLSLYRSGQYGYSSSSNGRHGTGGKFYDDNSWIGLAQVKAYKQTGNTKYLQDARNTFQFVQSGQYKGGLLWKEHGTPRQWDACAEGPAAELALQLHAAPGNSPAQSQQYLQFAQQLDHNMDTHLRQPNGLYRNSVNADDPGERMHGGNNIWSYNQGTAIGLKTQLYQATGEHKYLQQAQQTANASLQYFSRHNRLNKQGAGFNAIYYRNLAQLNQVAPNPRYQASEAAYARTLWQGRSRPSNLIGGPNTPLLAQAGASQIFSMLAMSPGQQATLT